MNRALLILIFSFCAHLSAAAEAAKIEHLFPRTAKPLANEKILKLIWSWEIRNPDGKVHRDVEFLTHLPMLQAPGQALLSVKASRPIEITTDGQGHALVKLRIAELAPYDSLKLELRCEVLLHPVLTAQAWAPADFKQPSAFVDCDDPRIKTLAAELKTAQAISTWIGTEIKSLPPCADTLGALICLQKKEGDCTEKALLMAALCRASKTPAAPCFGYLVPHSGVLSPFAAHDSLYIAQGDTWSRQEPGLAPKAKIPNFIAFRLIGSPASTLLGGEVRHSCSHSTLEITMNPK